MLILKHILNKTWNRYTICQTINWLLVFLIRILRNFLSSKDSLSSLTFDGHFKVFITQLCPNIFQLHVILRFMNVALPNSYIKDNIFLILFLYACRSIYLIEGTQIVQVGIVRGVKVGKCLIYIIWGINAPTRPRRNQGRKF